MNAQQRATAFALSLGLALLAWLGLRGDAPRPEPEQVQVTSARRAPARRVEAPEPPRAAPKAEASEADHEGHGHADHDHEMPQKPAAPAPAPSATPSQGVPEGPALAEPPRTPDSWIVPLELGWSGAKAEQPIRTEVDFRPLRGQLHDVLFQARFCDASGALFDTTVPVAGLIPLELADEGQEMHAIGDQLLLSRAPVLLRLPDLELPIEVRLSRPDGVQVATLLLQEVQGEVRVAVQ